MPNTDLIPNIQEQASTIYTPIRPSKKAQICLECPLKSCKPKNCERYRTEFKKLKEEKSQT